MTSDLLNDERKATLDAIDRRREECSVRLPTRLEFYAASPSALRRFASSVRAAAWNDKSESAEEAGEFADDPGWAPSGALRAAALVDHLSELSSPTASDLQPPAPPNATLPTRPPTVEGAWAQKTSRELAARLDELVEGGSEVAVFDATDGTILARATSWRGEIVEVTELLSLGGRKRDCKAIQQRRDASNDEKRTATAELAKLDRKEEAWGGALVRAGYSRAHFGPELTAEFFRRHVVDRERLDVTVDVNAIANGLVHHIARIASHVDFARSAITDLEIQRLADHDKVTWRKACRALESFPVDGPAWRSLGLPDTTALLVARADQKGDKAAGADALLAHNFEEALVRAHGVRAVLLTSDNGLARTVAARLHPGVVWVGYVDPLVAEQRFVSPILSWPKGTISESRYACLGDLLDELLVCGVADNLIATDGSTTLELRAHLDGEHQYVADWRASKIFVRGFGTARVGTAAVGRWPLRELAVPRDPRPSGARVTVDHVATALEWVRSSNADRLSREQLPLEGDARNEAWNFLRAIEAIDNDGRLAGQTALAAAAAQREVDAIRLFVLRFEPVAKIVAAIDGGSRTVTATREASDLGERTFGSALTLSVACGLIWRHGNTVGSGSACVSREAFSEWLLATLPESMRISALAERASHELRLSPVRFSEGLAAVIDDPRLVGARGGTAETNPLDSRALTVDEDGRISIQELRVDDMLGLRSLGVRQ